MTARIVAETHTFDDALLACVADFPDEDKPELCFERPAPVQFDAGLSISIALSPTLISLLFAGAAGAAGAYPMIKKFGEKIAEKAAEDLYAWFKRSVKRLFSRADQQAAEEPDAPFERRALRLRIRPSDEQHESKLDGVSSPAVDLYLLDICYDPVESAPESAFRSDAILRPFELVIAPVLMARARAGAIGRIIIQARVESPDADSAGGGVGWSAMFNEERLNGQTEVLQIPTYFANGVQRRYGQSIEVEAEPFVAPPLVLETGARRIHWRGCPVLATQGVDHVPLWNAETAMGEGYRACNTCCSL